MPTDKFAEQSTYLNHYFSNSFFLFEENISSSDKIASHTRIQQNVHIR